MSASTTRALAEWFESAHRPLPWRETYDPYRVWLSEVMLQQTQVDTVLPYYHRFLERFQDVNALARSEESAVLELWSGLGYYSRARNLRAAAALIVEEHAGRIPADHAALLELPGIGRYMAGAIMSIAFNQAYPIVDGNVRRVLARFHGWQEPTDAQLWEGADRIVLEGEPRTVNQAMMELGATVCTFRAPRCHECPWQTDCAAWATGRPAEIPAPRKRPQTIRLDLYAVVDRNGRGVLMREKKGLWEFPMLAEPPSGLSLVGHCRHAITHHRVEVDVFSGPLPEGEGYRRVRFEDVPVTSLTRKIFKVFTQNVMV